jgi:NAD(P)-dependent dehydrogenase (short-subunit alcohol dehydrogenase family)
MGMKAVELFNLAGRKALVTGAGRGIGRVLAISLAEAGCDVSIVEINMEGALKVAEEIKKLGQRALAFKVDVTKQAELEKAFSASAQELGGLDICINSAGVCRDDPGENTAEEHFDFVIDTDLKGTFLCCQAAAKVMIPRKKGSIINIASMSGTVVNYPQKHAHYNAAKAGVIMMTKCLAVEWATLGIRVNSISPGYTRTDLTARASPSIIAQWESRIPMERMADPLELAGAALYLASDASSYTTGSDIIVDGGYTAL